MCVVLFPFGQAWLFARLEPHVQPLGAFAPHAQFQVPGDAVGIHERHVKPLGHLPGSDAVKAMRVDERVGTLGEVAPNHCVHQDGYGATLACLVHEALQIGIEGRTRLRVAVGLGLLVVVSELDDDVVARLDLGHHTFPSAFVDEREAGASVHGVVVDADALGVEELAQHHAPAPLLLAAGGVLVGHGRVAYHEDGGDVAGRGCCQGKPQHTCNQADECGGEAVTGCAVGSEHRAYLWYDITFSWRRSSAGVRVVVTLMVRD